MTWVNQFKWYWLLLCVKCVILLSIVNGMFSRNIVFLLNNIKASIYFICHQRKAFCRQRIPVSSCLREETVDIGIFIISSGPPMGIRKYGRYQSNTYRKDLSWFDDDPVVQKRQKVLNIPASVAYLTYESIW